MRSLVQCANKAGGEDNITAIAFRVSADGDAEPAADDTVTMPAVEEPGDPDERTPESVDVEPSSEITPPAISQRRVLVVLGALVVLLIVAGLLIWGLSR